VAIPKQLLDEVNRWIDEKRYGHLQINFSAGKIVNVNRVESIKVDLLFTTSPDLKVTATMSTQAPDIA